jgi:hypothetical protein
LNVVNTMVENLMARAAELGFPAEPLRLPAGQVADETAWRAKLEAASYPQLQNIIAGINDVSTRRQEAQNRERARRLAELPPDEQLAASGEAAIFAKAQHDLDRPARVEALLVRIVELLEARR